MLTPLLLTLAARAVAQCPSLAPSYPAPSVAPGYEARLIAQNLEKPRGIVFDSKGNLLVVERGKGISAHQLNYGDGSCVSVKKSTTIIADKTLNHGIELSPNSKKLYASNAGTVYEYNYDASKASNTSSGKALITGMQSDGLVTRTLLIPRKSSSKILVSRGGSDNLDIGTVDLSSGRSQIRIFDIGGDAKDYTTGEVLAWGLRNAVGVAENPLDGGIWSVENNVDDLSREGEEINENNPAEELNYHGTVKDNKSPNRGKNFGFPLCVPAWNISEIPSNAGLQVGIQFAIGEENATRNDDFCRTERVAPRLSLAPHTAPLDIKFDSNGETAYVSFHGSWNREDPIGYSVSAIKFGADGQPVDPSTSMTAASAIVGNSDVDDCPGNCFRPVGLAWDKAGRLYFSSDSTGEIYVVVKDGKGVDTALNSAAGQIGGGFSAFALLVPLAACVISYLL